MAVNIKSCHKNLILVHTDINLRSTLYGTGIQVFITLVKELTVHKICRHNIRFVYKIRNLILQYISIKENKGTQNHK